MLSVDANLIPSVHVQRRSSDPPAVTNASSRPLGRGTPEDVEALKHGVATIAGLALREGREVYAA